MRVVVAALLALVLIGVVSCQAQAATRSGAVALATGFINQPAGVATAPNGEIFVGATARAPRGPGDLLLAAVDSRGRADPRFTHDGLAGRLLDLGGEEEATDIAVDAGGGILQVGCSHRSGQTNIALVRWLPSGDLDQSFGNGGVARTSAPPSSCSSKLALQSDGKILVAGQWNRAADDGGAQGLLLRFLPNGQLDPSFAVGGSDRLDLVGSDDRLLDIAVQSDGRIVAVGETTTSGTTYQGVALRVFESGQLDPSFAGDGSIELGDWTSLNAVNLRGSELVATGVSGRVHSQALLLSINPLGAISKQVTVPLLSRLTKSPAYRRLVSKHRLPEAAQRRIRSILNLGDGSYAAAIQAGGRVLLAGSAGFSTTGFNLNDEFDSGFGSGQLPGLALVLPRPDSYLGLSDDITGLAVDSSNRVVGVGGSAYGGLAVVRWVASGKPDLSFGLPSLKVREARADLRGAGRGRIRVEVDQAAAGVRARLSLTTIAYGCRFVNFPPGAMAPDGRYCQWKVVGKPKKRTITLGSKQLIKVGPITSKRRVVVGLQIKSFDALYGHTLGAQLRAVVNAAGVHVCHGGGRYSCGGLG